MLLSALSFLDVAQSSSEVPEGLMNNPVFEFHLFMAGFQEETSKKVDGCNLLCDSEVYYSLLVAVSTCQLS